MTTSPVFRVRRRVGRWMFAALFATSACVANDINAPKSRPQAATLDRGGLPGSKPGFIDASGRMRGCTPSDPQFGTAVIGPSGGELIVGKHRLIVPPGALTRETTISGRSGTDSIPAIYFEPHGLQFKRPAGLILDAGNCTDVPDVVYLNDVVTPLPLIRAVYSTLWRTIAAPIDHFSGYEVAFRQDEEF